MQTPDTKKQEGKQADLRIIPKKYRPAFHAKRAAIKLGVINNFGTELSQEHVTVDGLENAVVVDANALITSAIAGRIVPRKYGMGLDTRYLTKDFRIKYKLIEGAALAEMERLINERVATCEILTAEDFAEILAMCNINTFTERFVIDNEPEPVSDAEFWADFSKSKSLIPATLLPTKK